MIRFKQKNITILTPNKLVNYVWQQPDPTGPDADATAFLTAAGITDPTTSNAVQNLTKDLKNYGIWTKMKAIYPFVGGTSTTHKFNLKDPRDLDAAFRLTFFGGWIHSANGALPNGTNAYASTFLTPSISLSSSLSLSYYSRTNANTGLDQVDFGVIASPDFFYLSTQYNASGLINKFFGRCTSGTIAVDVTNLDARGFYYIGKQTNAALALKGFKNGVLVDSQTGAGNNPNLPIYIGACNLNGSPSFYTNRQSAFASVGDGLTDTEAANFYTAVQTFQTALGRNV